MEYFNKFRSTVTQVAAQVSNALPGNPLTREYEVGEQIGTAGQGLYWKIYKATKKSTKQSVAVWLFDKKDMERWPREDKELFLSIIKRGVSQLTRLRHPRLLVIEHAIEESRDSLAFATEPIFTSLANCLGKRDNLPSVLPHLSDFKLLDIEIKHGLLQIGEALAFLHVDARMLHRNVCPESILINDRGAWKLAGFDFSAQGVAGGSNGQATYDPLEWNERIPSLCQPNLDYLAPEYVMGGRPCPNSDVFSLGALAHAVFNKGAAPLEHRNALDRFKKSVDKLKTFPQQFAENIPPVFKDDFKMCLNYSPDLRPDANQFTKIAYFEDPLVKALNYFESLMQMDNNQKMQFFKSLPTVLTNFDKRPLLQKVMPWLAGEFSTPDLIPFILPSVFLITEQASKREFTAVILPQLVPVFSMERPYQIALLLLQKMELLLEKADEEDVKRHILPLIYASISSETTRIQELCLSIVPNIGKLVDRNSMKTQLLPKLLKLATEGGVLAIRVQALVCLGKLLPTLESWMVTEQILPTLPKISSKEPGLLMAILGIYKLSFESDSLSVGREQLAKSALPFLMASSVENTLNLAQFEQYMSLIKAILTKVETEQRSRLQQLSAGQEEQRGVPNFDEVLKPTGGSSSKDLPRSLDGLALDGLVSGGQYGGSTPTGGVPAVKNTGAMSLEEKKRLAAEQEHSRQMKSQPQLTAAPSSKPTLAQLSGAPSSNFGSFGTAAAASGTGIASVSSNTSAFNSLFDPIAPTTSVQSARGTVDLSDFLPTGNSSAAPLTQPSSSSMSFPSTGAFSTSAAPSLGGISFAGGPTPMGLPQPPRSSNLAVSRPSAAGPSSLDSLFSFPSAAGSQQKTPIGQMGQGQYNMSTTGSNGFGLMAPPPSSGHPLLKPQPGAKLPAANSNDPFADLLS